MGVAGGGGILGLLFSGLLVQWFSWSSFFTLNVALTVLGLVGTIVVVPRSRDETRPGLDPVGAVLSMAGIAALIYAIIEGPGRGWGDSVTLGALAISAAAISLFVGWELHIPQPMLDPRLFRRPGFAVGSLSVTTQFLAAFGFFFVIIQYLQFVAGLSPLQTAAAMLPAPVVLIPLARRAPVVAQRVGSNRLDAAGLALIAAGFVIISFLGTDFAYWQFALGLVLFGAGMAFAGTPATTAIVFLAPGGETGWPLRSMTPRASWAVPSGSRFWAAFSTASTAPASAIATAPLPPAAATQAKSSIAFVEQAAPHFGAVGQSLLDKAEAAFVDGMSLAVLVAAGLLVLASVYVALRGPRHTESAPEGSAPEGSAPEGSAPEGQPYPAESVRYDGAARPQPARFPLPPRH